MDDGLIESSRTQNWLDKQINELPAPVDWPGLVWCRGRDLVFSHLTIVRFSRVEIVDQVARVKNSSEDQIVQNVFCFRQSFLAAKHPV